MVKLIAAAAFVCLFGLPAPAQEDFPRIQTSMGYANLGFPSGPNGEMERHSGFANQTSINLTRTLGLDNYMGIYGLGQSVTLISEVIGGKVMWRGPRVVPYALAGIGIGYFTAQVQGYVASRSVFSTRYGMGADIPINDTLAWKVEASRLGLRIQSSPNSGWTSSWNFSTGIVFNISQ